MRFIQTVNGKIAPEHLGKTMMHEHCLIIQPDSYRTIEGADPAYIDFLNSKISLENRWKINYHMHKHVDNLDLSSEDDIIRELQLYKAAGGSSIVDVTPLGIGRDVRALQRISQATGLHIIACSGLYIEDSVPKQFLPMSKEEIATFFLDEIQNGLDGTDVKPGYIGEMGMSDYWTDFEVKALRAAGIACRESGLSMTVHMSGFRTWGERILDILEDEGTNLDRVVLSHCDGTLYDRDYHISLLDRGCRLQFDQFALEFPCTVGPYVKRWLPRDIERIRHIKWLCDQGYADRITVSQDLCFKSLYRIYGGPGICHILEDLVEFFLFEGVTEQQMNQILIQNPIDILTQDSDIE